MKPAILVSETAPEAGEVRQFQVFSRSFYIQTIPGRGAWPDLPGEVEWNGGSTWSLGVDLTVILVNGTPGDGRSRRTRDGLGALATGGHGCGRCSFVDHGRM